MSKHLVHTFLRSLKPGVLKSSFALVAAAIVLSVLAVSVLGAPAAQDGPVEPAGVTSPQIWIWDRQRVDAPRLFYNMTNHSMRVDSSGYVHIAYGGDHLYYARYDGTDWLITTVDTEFGVGQYASLALDKNKRPHISYYDYYNGRLKYAYYDGTTWHVDAIDGPAPDSLTPMDAGIPPEDFPSLVEPFGRSEWLSPVLQADSTSQYEQAAYSFPGVGLYSSIAVDSNGAAHISYFDQVGGDLKYATNASGVWAFTYVDTQGKVGLYTSIAVDSNRRPYISYFNETEDSLKYAHYNGSSWSKTTVDGGDAIINRGGYTSIALDASRNPHISYYDATAGDLRYATRLDGTWTTSVVDSQGDVGGFTSIVLDDDDDPHISYYSFSNNSLKYARTTSTGWDTSTVVSSDVGQFTSIILDNTDYPHIAFVDLEESALTEAYWRGSSWGFRDIDSLRDVGLSTSMRYNDATNRPYISYYNASTADLKYATLSGTNWQIEIVSEEGQVGEYNSLELDVWNNPKIAYYNAGTQELQYANFTAGSWHYDIIDTSGNVGLYPSLELDALGNPHVSYYDLDNGNLKYAFWNTNLNPPDWDITTVDSSGDVGQYTSLVLDGTSTPQIIYYDVTNKDLKHARWDGAQWLTQALDSSGDVGKYTSFVLGAGGIPHISYYDETNGDLKYMTYTTAWTSTVVDSVGTTGQYTSISTDEASKPHISYYDFTNGDLKFASLYGTTWFLQTVDTLGDVGMYSSLDFDDEGTPYITYFDGTNGDLKLAAGSIVGLYLYLPELYTNVLGVDD